MNEEALRVLYGLAMGDGYTDPYESFKDLMATNEEAVGMMYSHAQRDGYTDPYESFKVLVGYQDPTKKKGATVSDFKVTGSEPTPSKTGRVSPAAVAAGGAMAPSETMGDAKRRQRRADAAALAEALDVGRGELVEVADVQAAAKQAGFSDEVIDQYYQDYQGFEKGEWTKEVSYEPESKEAFKDKTGLDADDLRLTDKELSDFFKTGLIRGVEPPKRERGIGETTSEFLSFVSVSDQLRKQGADRIAAEVSKQILDIKDLEYGEVRP
jgi:hypothetical protein